MIWLSKAANSRKSAANRNHWNFKSMPGTDEVNEGESTKISLTFNWIFRGSWFHSASQWQSLLLSHGLMNIQGTLYIKIACNVITFSWAKNVLTFWGKFVDSTDHVFIVLPAGDPDVSKTFQRTRKISSSPVFPLSSDECSCFLLDRVVISTIKTAGSVL